MKLSFATRLFSSIFLASFLILSCNNEDKSSTTTTDTSTVVNTDTSTHDMTNMNDTAALSGMMAHVEATLMGTYPDTAVTGTVKFDTTSGGKVKMQLDITVAAKANKSVAVHIHEHGDCGDTAKMAHGHWNPTMSDHGKWGSAKFHSGDIGNVKLDSKGHGTMTISTDRWTIGGTSDKNIRGKSIIVHGGVDDYKTQPSGNSGARIGCGVIQ